MSERIEIVVDAEVVTGEVTVEPFELTVKLIEPYPEMCLSAGSHVPMQARTIAQGFEQSRGAKQVAADILRDLFQIARHVSNHRDELRDRWLAALRDFDRRPRPRCTTAEDIRAVGAESRRRLREGVITGREHQYALRAARQGLREWSARHRMLKEGFVTFNLRPFAISYDVADRVIAYLTDVDRQE